MADMYPPPAPGVETEIDEGHKPPPSAIAQLMLVVGVIGGLMALGAVVGRSEKKAEEPTASASAEPAAPAADAPAATAETPAESKPAAAEAAGLEVKTLQSRLDGLADQIKGIEGKVDSLTKNEPRADTKALEGKVDELARSIAAVAPMSEKVSQLGGRIDAMDASIKSFKDEVSGLTAEVKKLQGSSAPVAASTGATTEPKLAEGIDLFKAGKYKEAGDFFKKAEATNPDDARVYYYEAFANALTTNDWKGETLKLAAKAAALEKAGTTKTAAVDAAFAELPSTLKPWLAFFRTQASTP